MVLLVLIAGLAGWYSHQYWMRLGDAQWTARYSPWLLRGLVFPILVWSVANIGFGDRFPALVPQIVDAQMAKQPWFGLWFGWLLVGVILVGMYWSAVTYVWLLVRIIRLAEEKKELVVTLCVVGLVSGGIAGLCLYFSSWTYAGAAIATALMPMIHFTIDLAEKPAPLPTYSRAVSKIKFGKYKDAEWEVISQLEKSENDFEGWMMLAELYARQYRNLDDAARVIFDVCRHPDTQVFQKSLACHKLADWQLEIAENPLGARAALELLARLTPGSHFARMAEQRMRQIPSTVEEFDEAKKPRRIRLPVLKEEPAVPVMKVSPAADAVSEANRLTEKLTEDPNDITARQKLAAVLAEKLGKIDLAAEQLRLLIDLAEPSDEQKALWSAQIASWEFSRDQDNERFAAALRNIVRTYPQTSHAFAVYLLEMSFNMSPSVA
jgi:hypothetical protein